MIGFIRLIILLLMPVMGCATTQIQPELLHGLEVKHNKLRLRLISNGCTTEESFQLVWQGDKLTVKRIKPDLCRRMPHKKWFEFEISNQASEFSLINKFSR